MLLLIQVPSISSGFQRGKLRQKLSNFIPGVLKGSRGDAGIKELGSPLVFSKFTGLCSLPKARQHASVLLFSRCLVTGTEILAGHLLSWIAPTSILPLLPEPKLFQATMFLGQQQASLGVPLYLYCPAEQQCRGKHYLHLAGLFC